MSLCGHLLNSTLLFVHLYRGRGSLHPISYGRAHQQQS